MNLGERIRRLERALGEAGYLIQGPHGISTLDRQTPAWAQLVREYMVQTAPRDGTFAGRTEKAIPLDTSEKR